MCLLSFLLTFTITLVDSIDCDSTYNYHLQGFAIHGERIYWSFGEVLVKTNRAGDKQDVNEVSMHHGGLTYYNGDIYVAGSGAAGQNIMVYDTTDLSFVTNHAIGFSSDGINYHADTFAVVVNAFVYLYNTGFEYDTSYNVGFDCGTGIQNICNINNAWYIGTYVANYGLVELDEKFFKKQRHPQSGAHGIGLWNTDTLALGQSTGSENNWGGRIYLYIIDRSPIRLHGAILRGILQ